MATRSITTTRPAVACDVCGRNLLRGEQPAVFLAGGERRVVCELCVGRATMEGWLRETDGHLVPPRPPRGRRARSLMGRLRQLREPAPPEAEPDLDASALAEEGALEAPAPAPAEPAPPVRAPAPRPRVADSARASRTVHAVPTNAELKAARALEVFNGGPEPRRVAGVARSLGDPQVTARSLPSSGSVVSIVVAWELCWYRYEVDLAEETAGARLVDQGMELDQLDAQDRIVNAIADESGELHPSQPG